MSQVKTEEDVVEDKWEEVKEEEARMDEYFEKEPSQFGGLNY